MTRSPGAQTPGTSARVAVCRDCCCGSVRKHPGVDHASLVDRLVEHTAGIAEVTVTRCLLACERSDVVVVVPSREGRLAGARPVWLGRVLDAAIVDAVVRWLQAGGPGLAPLPPELSGLRTVAGLASQVRSARDRRGG